MKRPLSFLIFGLALISTSFALDPPPGGGYPYQTTALGDEALLNYVPTGLGGNTALGFRALKSDTTGHLNTAVGEYALLNNTTGLWNIAVGAMVLELNTSGSGNVSIGTESMINNTTGGDNTAIGLSALHGNKKGSFNTAIGANSLFYNTGEDNTAVGALALFKKTEGNDNIAIGNKAGFGLKKGSNNIDIGNAGETTDSGVIRIGTATTHTSTYIAGISGVTVAAGVAVVVDSSGQLGTVTSSARYKDDIKPMGQASETILDLQPVSFRYKNGLDPKRIPQFGLVAEDVAKVDPDLVVCDERGKPYTVRYEAVNAMLLNEFLKEHKKVEDQARRISELESVLKQVTGRLDAEGL